MAGKFKALQPDIPIAGRLQGGALHFGRGRVAIFGEAAMFTVQRDDDGNLTGLGDTGAEQNTQFVLNVLHWLSGVLEPKDQT